MATLPVSNTAQSLYVDPTPAYQPALNRIKADENTANERYATNKADIANIFGQLTTARQADVSRINTQFEQSLINQQESLAKRTAEARTGMGQTMQAAQVAGDERGSGPMGNLAASPAMVAGERGIADANAFQTIWEGQQGAIQNQTQQNLQNAITGYGYEQVSANKTLQRSLEDTLSGLSRQRTGVMSDLAGAKISGQQTVKQANYQEVLTKQAQDAAARVAGINAASRVQNAPKKYSPGANGVFEKIAEQAGSESSVAFSQSIADILAGSAAGFGQKATGPSSLSDALAKWIRANPELAPFYQGYANEVFSDIYSKSIPQPRTGSSSTGRTTNPFGFGNG